LNRVICVEVCNEQSALPVDADLARRAVAVVLAGESVTCATISIAVVDDPTMRELNRRYLNHDYNTDVLSFLLDESDGRLDGEIIVSADTAIMRASEFAWSADDEMLLYVIHGTLHLTGYDDHSDVDRGRMRRKEMQYLQALGRDPQRADPDGESRRVAENLEIPENRKEG
jgi:probable rRNA maturation factor